MDFDYDENLNENSFFNFLQSDNYELFEKATYEGWVICVPRSGTLSSLSLNNECLASHILIPSDELPETHFTSLSGKEVKIVNGVITSSSHNTKVLFEETFYTVDSLKYKVLCIEGPLDNPSSETRTCGVTSVHSLRNCIDLLWAETSKDVLEGIDDEIKYFLNHCPSLEERPLKDLKIFVRNLYENCLEIALSSSSPNVKTDKHLLDNVKVSVEALVHHGVYKRVFAGIMRNTAQEDSKFNKITRNLSDVQVSDLDIRLDLHHTVPKARLELSRLDKFSTVLGKVSCIRRTLQAISKQEHPNAEGAVIAADDLLPMLVFLVIKTGLSEWIAHLTFMKEFSFSFSKYHSDQLNFLVTSLEAAIEHVRNGSVLYLSDVDGEINGNHSDGTYTKLSLLFDMARDDNLEEVQKILLLKSQPCDSSILIKNLCHPLCNCEKCVKEIGRTLNDEAPTVNTTDERGLTVLHIASMSGHPRILNHLLAQNANVNATDLKGKTPLHYAASKGHQNALLLLLHHGASLKKQDGEGNIPMHYACLNGHEGCVKAMLYYAEHNGTKINVNCKNATGDTPLHHASRWGYEEILAILLEYGGNPSIENKRKSTPLTLAHDLNVMRLMKSHVTTSPCDMNGHPDHSQTLDFCDEESKPKPAPQQSNPTDQIRKIERLLRAISYGDTRLACFYLGIEIGTHSLHDWNACHPLCPCKGKGDESSVMGNAKDSDYLHVNVSNSDGLTPLHVAAMYGRIEMVRLLLQAGANINATTKRNGLTALQLACQSERLKTVKALLETGKCDINYQDSSGNTALHHACLTSNPKLVEMLVQYEPQVDVRNSLGKTPLAEAEGVMSLSLVQLLSNLKMS